MSLFCRAALEVADENGIGKMAYCSRASCSFNEIENQVRRCCRLFIRLTRERRSGHMLHQMTKSVLFAR